jgi:hypothetical protein
MRNVFYAEAIQALRPNEGFTLDGIDYNTLKFANSDVIKPTEQEILDKVNELEIAYQSKEYARKRVEEYPSIGDQLDALFHAGVFPEEMAVKIQAIKDKYPKS